jgi:hypothetical protein
VGPGLLLPTGAIVVNSLAGHNVFQPGGNPAYLATAGRVAYSGAEEGRKMEGGRGKGTGRASGTLRWAVGERKGDKERKGGEKRGEKRG